MEQQGSNDAPSAVGEPLTVNRFWVRDRVSFPVNFLNDESISKR
jgi:hypothetical protein